MSHPTLYNLLQNLEAENVVLAYKGEMNAGMLETVYSMMDSHLEEKKTAAEKKKKFFLILVEALQNVLHHQANLANGTDGLNPSLTGFVIRKEKNDAYNIMTGNYLLNSEIEKLQNKLIEVNNLTPEELRNYHKQSLANNDFSEKGGAGLGIIEMARKSGSRLNFEFDKVNEKYSFFSLSITIP